MFRPAADTNKRAQLSSSVCGRAKFLSGLRRVADKARAAAAGRSLLLWSFPMYLLRKNRNSRLGFIGLEVSF